MADTSTPAPAKGMGSLAILFVMWYAFNAYYNVSNKMVVRTWFFPYTCAFLQVMCSKTRSCLMFRDTPVVAQATQTADSKVAVRVFSYVLLLLLLMYAWYIYLVYYIYIRGTYVACHKGYAYVTKGTYAMIYIYIFISFVFYR